MPSHLSKLRESAHRARNHSYVIVIDRDWFFMIAPFNEFAMTSVLQSEDSLSDQPVIEGLGDFISFVCKDCKKALEFCLLGDVPQRNIAPENAPPSVTFKQISVLYRPKIDEL